MGFMYRKAESKPQFAPKQKKTKLQQAKGKQTWVMLEYIKVIFNDESHIYFRQQEYANANI